MAMLGFSTAIILLLVLDINMILPYHVHHYSQESSSDGGDANSKLHGRVKINANGYEHLIFRNLSAS